MPRNSNGVYSLPISAYVAGTTIKSTDMNSNLSDIATALTGSLPTNGSAPMLSPLILSAGTLGAPGLTFPGSLSSGLYLAASNNPAMVVQGATVQVWTTSGTSIVGNVSVTGTIQSNGVSIALPVGIIAPYSASASAPTGWKFANGQAISRTTFATYFALVGTTYGIGDGATTFNVPDLRARMPLGLDNMGGAGTTSRVTVAGGNFDATILGNTGGAQNHTMTSGELVSHAHTITDTGHTHDVKYDVNLLGPGGATVVIGIGSGGGTTGSNAAISKVTGITINSTGSGTPFTVMNPAITLSYIVFVGA